MESVRNPQPPASQECAGQSWALEGRAKGSPTLGGNSALHSLLGEEEKTYELLFILKHLIPLQCLFWGFVIIYVKY